MKEIEATLAYIGNLLLFIVLTVLFVPSFLIVTYLQPVWTKKLEGIFHV